MSQLRKILGVTHIKPFQRYVLMKAYFFSRKIQILTCVMIITAPIGFYCYTTSKSQAAGGGKYEACQTAPAGMVCIPGGKSYIGRKALKPEEMKAGAVKKYSEWNSQHSNYLMGNDVPEYAVEVSTYYLDRNEVTNADYQKCIEAGACKPYRAYKNRLYDGFRGAKQPAVPISWKMAFDYCKWAGKRLPTEAEWEKAARGGEKNTTYPWGEGKPDCSKAKYRGCEKNEIDRTKDVGSYPAGHYGVNDMAGNGYEWVNDWASDCRQGCKKPCHGCLGKDPQGPCSGKYPCKGHSLKVLKGGSFWWPEEHMRAYSRRLEKIESGGNRLSFRCATSSPYPNTLPGWMISTPPPALPDPQPPTAEELKILHNLEGDVFDKPLCKEIAWSKADCKDPLVYVTGNESQHFLFLPYLKNLGGGYMGVAADANYSFVAWARSRWVWLFDYDIVIVRLHHILKAFIKASDSPANFISLFKPGSIKKGTALIEKAYTDKKESKRMVFIYKSYREKLYKHYVKVSRKDKRYGDFGWLRNPEAYRYVRLLYQQNRIAILQADMLKDKGMRSIAASAKGLGTIVRIYYPSNAEEMWKFNDNYKKNVASLPFDERSVALRTIWQGYYTRWGVKTVWQKKMKGIYWHYVIHGGLDYQRKILLPDYNDVDAWKEERLRTKNELLSIINLPGAVPEDRLGWEVNKK